MFKMYFTDLKTSKCTNVEKRAAIEHWAAKLPSCHSKDLENYEVLDVDDMEEVQATI